MRFTAAHWPLRLILLVASFLGCRLCSPCNGSYLFHETFEDGVANDISVNFGSFSLTTGLNGSTHGWASENHISGGQIFCLDGIKSDNVRIDADFVVGDQWYGDFEIGFNVSTVTHQDYRSPDGYWVTIHPSYSDSTDAILRMIVNPVDGLNNGITIASSPWVIGANEVRTLSVERLGDTIRSFVDGNPFMSATDDTYHGGSIYFRFFGPGTIDNIRVTDLVAVPAPGGLATWTGLATMAVIYRWRKRRRSKS